LWATIGWLPQCETCAASDEGKPAWARSVTTLLAFDIDSQRMTRRVDSPIGGLLGDMTIGSAGDLYVSDSKSGAIFHLAPDALQLERIDPPGEFASPQQPALSADESTLYVADYLRGIAITYPLARVVGPVQHRAQRHRRAESPRRLVHRAERHHAGAHRSGSLDLKQLKCSKQLAGLGEPTHGTLIGNRYLFVANTGWPEYDDSGKKRGSAPVVSSIHGRLEPNRIAHVEYVKDKVIVITGAASGFGRLVSEKTASLGAKVVCADIKRATRRGHVRHRRRRRRWKASSPTSLNSNR
jgi:hypothetical protein